MSTAFRLPMRAAITAIGLTTALAACSSVSIRNQVDVTSAFSQREMGVSLALHSSDKTKADALARARALLGEPLSMDGAVEIALRYSPGFQVMLAESAAATAATDQSARIANPLLEYSPLSAGPIREIDRALSASLLDFVLWPQRRRLAAMQQVQHRLRSAGDVVSLATQTRAQWVVAVAASQSARYAEQVQVAAAGTAELARRMQAVGNFAPIERARQQAFYADATAELARARLDAADARETLIRTLGLPDELSAQLTLPERLPDVPISVASESTLTERAFDERLDIRLARAELDYTARSLGLTKVTSLVNAFELGAVRNSVPDEGTLKGYRLELRLPLFDFGDAKRANAQVVYLAAVNRAAQVAVDAHSQLRASYQTYRTAYDLARHYRDEVIPLRKSIADQNQLLYNGMLISVFDLLADYREQVAAVRQAIAAQRGWWLADSALRATLIGQPVPSLSLGSPAVVPGAGTSIPH